MRLRNLETTKCFYGDGQPFLQSPSTLPSEHWGAGDTTVQPGSLLDQYGTPAAKEMCRSKTDQINRSDGDWVELPADNSRGPGGPTAWDPFAPP
jgi:hypothetical protein